MSNKPSFVKFKLCKDGEFRFVKAPKECEFCNFAVTQPIDNNEEFKGCSIGHKIDEGKMNCPHDVSEERRKI